MPGVDKNACSSHRRKRRALVNVGRDRKSRGPAELHASFSAFEQLWRAHACIFHEQTDFNPRGMRSNYPPSPALGLAFVKNQPSSEPELPRPLSPPPSRPPLRKDSAGRRARGGRIINELPPGQLPSSTFSAFSCFAFEFRSDRYFSNEGKIARKTKARNFARGKSADAKIGCFSFQAPRALLSIGSVDVR